MDLLLIESGNGGDLLLTGKDLEVVLGYENLPYLAMFSGADWWANDLLEDKDKILCLTENIMNTTALNSSGRIQIEEAIKADLKQITDNTGAGISVSVNIAGADRVDININIKGQSFYMEWNPSNAYLNYRV